MHILLIFSVSYLSCYAISFTRSKIRLGEHTISNEGPDCAKGSCNEGVQDFDIAKIIYHPSYNKPNVFQNDIAIVKLNRKVTKDSKCCTNELIRIVIYHSKSLNENILIYKIQYFVTFTFQVRGRYSAYVKPICLPYDDNVKEDYHVDSEGEKLKTWVAGWGATDPRGNHCERLLHLLKDFRS